MNQWMTAICRVAEQWEAPVRTSPSVVPAILVVLGQGEWWMAVSALLFVTLVGDPKALIDLRAVFPLSFAALDRHIS